MSKRKMIIGAVTDAVKIPDKEDVGKALDLVGTNLSGRDQEICLIVIRSVGFIPVRQSHLDRLSDLHQSREKKKGKMMNKKIALMIVFIFIACAMIIYVPYFYSSLKKQPEKVSSKKEYSKFIYTKNQNAEKILEAELDRLSMKIEVLEMVYLNCALHLRPSVRRCKAQTA